MAKRTYSKYGRGQWSASYNSDWASDDSCKRTKVDDADHFQSKAQTEKRPSLLKKGLKFGGPTSIPNDAMNGGEDPEVPKKGSVFDRVLKSGRHQSARPSQITSSSLQVNPPRLNSSSKYTFDQRRNSQLLTPPAETQKALKAFDEQTSRRDEVPCTSKQIYVPRTYKAGQTTAPRKTILGDRLLRNSEEAGTWQTNQIKSPLLQLPAYVRNKIFKYVLGGRTIMIGYETYRNTFNDDEPKTSEPIFKYNCCVYTGCSNPFKLQHSRQEVVTRSYTTLNDVCRQLYQETATLPYELNLLAFSSSSVMFNFLYQERRLTRQQRNAITRLVIPDSMLEQNVLNSMRGLKNFYLLHGTGGDARVVYAVVREEGQQAQLVSTGSVC